jgi:hypothetical protein
MKAVISAVGIVAPGISDWAAATQLVVKNQTWHAEAIEKYAPERLPRHERRRATRLTRLAFCAADQAVEGVDASQVASVFASSGGDTDIVDVIARTLASADLPQLSPTQFHNSVHNSSGGYWSIATASQRPATSLAAWNDTVVAGLLEALLLLADGENQVLLVVYDAISPDPLSKVRPLESDMAVALLLSNDGEGVKLTAEPSSQPASHCNHRGLEQLRLSNPAGRLLPLLEILALGGLGEVVIGEEQALVLRCEQ